MLFSAGPRCFGGTMFFKRFLLCAALAFMVSEARADDCQLKQYASLDLIVDDNQVLVPITLAGQPGGYFILDFDSVVSGLADTSVRMRCI